MYQYYTLSRHVTHYLYASLLELLVHDDDADAYIEPRLILLFVHCSLPV